MDYLAGGDDCLPQPGSIPEEPDVSSSTTKLAFCELLLEHVGKGMCDEVACGSCPLVVSEFKDVETAWLCTVCAKEGAEYLPYYGDGDCQICGWNSCVLSLVRI